jgi:hypothetical protein
MMDNLNNKNIFVAIILLVEAILIPYVLITSKNFTDNRICISGYPVEVEYVGENIEFFEYKVIGYNPFYGNSSICLMDKTWSKSSKPIHSGLVNYRIDKTNIVCNFNNGFNSNDYVSRDDALTNLDCGKRDTIYHQIKRSMEYTVSICGFIMLSFISVIASWIFTLYNIYK